eukprot:1667476-Amphidinium_carterae.1
MRHYSGLSAIEQLQVLALRQVQVGRLSEFKPFSPCVETLEATYILEMKRTPRRGLTTVPASSSSVNMNIPA